MKTPSHSQTTVLDDPCGRLRIAVHIALWLVFGLGPAELLAERPQSSATQLWAQHYIATTNNAIDSASHVVVDAAGDVIVTGYTDNDLNGQGILTIKYSGLNGSVLWQRPYNGPDNGNDFPSALGLDRTGNVVVTGNSSWRGPSEYYTAKYASADGALLWERRDDGGGMRQNYARAAAVDANGNVVVTGMSGMSGTDVDFYTVKYAAADGTPLWSVRYNGPANGGDRAASVAADRNGNVVVTGGRSIGVYGHGFYTAKYAAADGAVLWEQTYDGPQPAENIPFALAVDTEGNTIVAGMGRSANATMLEWYIVKYAPDGALLWENHLAGLGGSATVPIKPLALDSRGDVVLVTLTARTNHMAKLASSDGTVLWQQNFGSQYFTPDVVIDGADNILVAGGTGQNLYTAKFSGLTGELAWEQSSGSSSLYAVAVDRNGNAVVTGTLRDSVNNGDIYTAKYSATDGEILWQQQHDGRLVVNASARAVAIDDNGDVAITGAVGSDYHTAKYAKASGALLWEQRYKGPANSINTPAGVALDSRGNVIVTGTSFNQALSTSSQARFGAPVDFYTAKYSSADGALLWERPFNGADDGTDMAAAIAVDPHDDVIVTGVSWSGSTLDFYTAKYASSDGAVLWEQRTPSDTIQDSFVEGLAVDKAGNVAITGHLFDYVGRYDPCTIKYAANGALLWKKCHGPSTQIDFRPSGLAFDPAGNVIVTGSFYSPAAAYIAKYAAADGALLWEKTFDAADHRGTLPAALAVDRRGNVVITGLSQNLFTDMDIFTAMFRESDGALVWEQHDAGPARNAVALKIDKAGNIVVAGDLQGRNFESYLASYAPRDGALRWETRYEGPFNRDNHVTGLAVGPDGMIAIAGTGSGHDVATIAFQETLQRARSR